MPPARFRVHALTLLAAIAVLLGAAIFGGAHDTSRHPLEARPVAAQVPTSVGARHVGAERAPQGGRCRGLVALTFDDGPAPGTTERLVHTLTRLGVPATFFMVGQRIVGAGSTVRTVVNAGFAIGDHTWAHVDLALQSPAAERSALLRTLRALHRDGVRTGHLMRPPYGALDRTARHTIRRLGLVPVLWTIDSLDWQSGTSAQIAHRILSALRPGPDNVVLQHDGVDRSPISIRAVPRVVRVARQRGYCFVGLDGRGLPRWPRGYHPNATA